MRSRSTHRGHPPPDGASHHPHPRLERQNRAPKTTRAASQHATRTLQVPRSRPPLRRPAASTSTFWRAIHDANRAPCHGAPALAMLRSQGLTCARAQTIPCLGGSATRTARVTPRPSMATTSRRRQPAARHRPTSRGHRPLLSIRYRHAFHRVQRSSLPAERMHRPPPARRNHPNPTPRRTPSAALQQQQRPPRRQRPQDRTRGRRLQPPLATQAAHLAVDPSEGRGRHKWSTRRSGQLRLGDRRSPRDYSSQ